MNIDIEWSEPIELVDGAKDYLIYKCTNMDNIPDAPGIYIFARRFAETLTPLYIGQAGSLRKRIDQQLNNTQLIKGIEAAEIGNRVLLVGTIIPRSGQRVDRLLDFAETAVMENAVSSGHSLLNKQGTTLCFHTIQSIGNKWSRKIVPTKLYVRDTK